MSKGFSVHAKRAIDQLMDSYVVTWFAHHDAFRVDATCPPEKSNRDYNTLMESYFGRLQVCYAADTFNSYCQSMLGEWLDLHADRWETISGCFPKEETPISLRKKLQHQQASDRAVREALRDGLNCFWSPETDVILVLRNKFVHQNGIDPKRQVEKEIRSMNGKWCDLYPVDLPSREIPVRYEAGDVLLSNLETGKWANAHIRNHISFMDQNLCHTYSLPRGPIELKTITRSFGNHAQGIR